MKRKNPAAVALGRLGGKKRVKNQTQAQRSALARHAVVVRWARERLKVDPSGSISIPVQDCAEILRVLDESGKGRRIAAALRRKISSFQTGR